MVGEVTRVIDTDPGALRSQVLASGGLIRDVRIQTAAQFAGLMSEGITPRINALHMSFGMLSNRPIDERYLYSAVGPKSNSGHPNELRLAIILSPDQMLARKDQKGQNEIGQFIAVGTDFSSERGQDYDIDPLTRTVHGIPIASIGHPDDPAFPDEVRVLPRPGLHGVIRSDMWRGFVVRESELRILKELLGMYPLPSHYKGGEIPLHGVYNPDGKQLLQLP